MDLRERRARQIVQAGNRVRHLGGHAYAVRSQTDCGKWYGLLHTSRGWTCECPDYVEGGHRCKHARAAELDIGDRARAERACMIWKMGGQLTRVSEDRYLVRSQRTGKPYEVTRSGGRWRCSCPDHALDGSHCKHAFAVEIDTGVREPERGHAVVRAQDPSKCKFCGSAEIIKKGFKTPRKGKIRQYKCKGCGRRFVPNLGFERKRATPEQITTAVEMLFGGMSTRKTATAVSARGARVSRQTVLNWAKSYALLMAEHMDQLVPQVGEEWMTDEIYTKMRGDIRYLFAMIDSKKRFWLAKMVLERKGTSDARRLFEEARDVGGKVPTWLVSDGAGNFHAAWKDLYRAKNFLHKETVHESHIHMAGDLNTNQMESFNGNTVRLREVAARGLKSEESAIITGLWLYHNFVRSHLGLEGEMTPGEAAGIIIEGKDKWKTMIQAAAKWRSLESGRADGAQDKARQGKARSPA